MEGGRMGGGGGGNRGMDGERVEEQKAAKTAGDTQQLRARRWWARVESSVPGGDLDSAV